MRTLLAASLLTLPLALPAAAQQLLPAPAPVFRGTYDVASQRLLPPGTGGQIGSADGAGLVEVYDNAAGGDGFYYLSPTDAIEFDWGNLSAGGLTAILQVDVAYATESTAPVDAVLRLHSGTGPDGKPGKGIAVPLDGLPGSPDGQLFVNVVTVNLGTPWVPEDEVNVGYGLHFPGVTDAPVSGPFIPPAQIDAKSKIGRYKLNGDHIADLGGGTNPLHFFMSMRGTAPDFAVGGVVKVLRRKDSLSGLIEVDGEVDVARYEGLMGELLDLGVVGGDGLEPTVSVVNLADDSVVVSAGGAGETKLKLKGVELPANGSYDIRVAGAVEVLLGEGAGTTGSYSLKVKGKLPKTAKKPPVAETAQAVGEALSSFHANAGALFNGTVKPGVKGGAAGEAPVLQGPLGPVDMGSHLSSKNGVHRVKNLPLPVAGGYVLQAGADDNGQLARVKLRDAKFKSGKLNELERALVGAWVSDDFIAPDRSKRVTLAPPKGGDSRIVTVLGQIVPNPNNPFDIDEYVIEVTQNLKTWKLSVPTPGVRIFSWEIALPVKVTIDGVPSSSGGTLLKKTESNVVDNPDGDPDRVRFVVSEEVWRRDVYQGPAAPTLTALVASDPTEVGEGGVSHPGLRMAGPANAQAYQVFKGTSDMFVPGPLFAVVQANGAGLDGSTEWVDLGSAPGTLRYWVRTVLADGAVSAHTSPIDVSP